MKDEKISGLVIGTRKSGTTWLYENMRQDPNVIVSEKVKESSFFTGTTRLNTARYHALFEAIEGVPRLEVDTSICYAKDAPECIDRYNPDMRIVLILREPASFLASRHTHSLRKGELSELDPAEALKNNAWLRDELDYPEIVSRFAPFKDRLTIFRYADIEKDPIKFYSNVLNALGVSRNDNFIPETQPVNVSRDSRLRVVSATLSQGAFAARQLGLHRIVNGLKSLGFHKKLESKNDNNQKSKSQELATQAIAEIMPDTLRFYNAL